MTVAAAISTARADDDVEVRFCDDTRLSRVLVSGGVRVFGVRPQYDDSHIDHEVRIAILDDEGTVLRIFGGWHFDDDEAVETVRPSVRGRPNGRKSLTQR